MLRKGLELNISDHLWTMHKQFCNRVALGIPDRTKPRLPFMKNHSSYLENPGWARILLKLVKIPKDPSIWIFATMVPHPIKAL